MKHFTLCLPSTVITIIVIIVVVYRDLWSIQIYYLFLLFFTILGLRSELLNLRFTVRVFIDLHFAELIIHVLDLSFR